MAIKTSQNRPAGREHVIEAPKYETLLGEGLTGSGFHFKAGDGQSGAPIVSGETGSVIAVLIGANSPEHATRIDAELLQLPEFLETTDEQGVGGKTPDALQSPN